MADKEKAQLPVLYHQMARMRRFETALAELWERGLISGELHLGTGEEAVIAGVTAHLVEGDAVALDHRPTPALVARGVDLKSMVLEMLGSDEGLCRGMGGHMHMFSPERLAASSGIVGASAPLGAGFALAAQHLRPGKVAVAFFGEGAMNQGMVMESLNLAAAWNLPLVFVCKDNHWAITTLSPRVTGGRLARRARSFGMPARRVDGSRVDMVWEAAGRAVARARKGRGPSFILARCTHLGGHFLGDPLLRVFSEPLEQMRALSGPLLRAGTSRPGARWRERLAGLASIGGVISAMGLERFLLGRDPLTVSARLVTPEERAIAEEQAGREVERAVAAALDELGGATHG